MKLLNSKAGVTILEGVIALGLLAVVTAGAFGVLVSASRKSSQPDIREEMTLAVEKAKNLLQMYVAGTDHVAAEYTQGLCGKDDNPMMETIEHHIECLLPPICDQSHEDSQFKYEVAVSPIRPGVHHLPKSELEEALVQDEEGETRIQDVLYNITFTIECNGYEL